MSRVATTLSRDCNDESSETRSYVTVAAKRVKINGSRSLTMQALRRVPFIIGQSYQRCSVWRVIISSSNDDLRPSATSSELRKIISFSLIFAELSESAQLVTSGTPWPEATWQRKILFCCSQRTPSNFLAQRDKGHSTCSSTRFLAYPARPREHARHSTFESRGNVTPSSSRLTYRLSLSICIRCLPLALTLWSNRQGWGK